MLTTVEKNVLTVICWTDIMKRPIPPTKCTDVSGVVSYFSLKRIVSEHSYSFRFDILQDV